MITICGSRARAMAIITRCRMPPESWCGWLPSRSAVIPTIASSSAALARAPAWPRAGRCARSTSVSWDPIDSTGLSAFMALCMTTEICDQRSTRSPLSPAASRSTVRPGWG
jgi:hypothetical protein